MEHLILHIAEILQPYEPIFRMIGNASSTGNLLLNAWSKCSDWWKNCPGINPTPASRSHSVSSKKRPRKKREQRSQVRLRNRRR